MMQEENNGYARIEDFINLSDWPSNLKLMNAWLMNNNYTRDILNSILDKLNILGSTYPARGIYYIRTKEEDERSQYIDVHTLTDEDKERLCYRVLTFLKEMKYDCELITGYKEMRTILGDTILKDFKGPYAMFMINIF